MELSKLKVSVIGCGWLGLPLCESLKAHNYLVKTTASTHLKQLELSPLFETHLFDIKQGEVSEELLASDVLIYTIPPLGLGEVKHFFNHVKPTQKIIFISSTSVYGKNQGEVTEESILDPHSQNALVLREAEDDLSKKFKGLTIIRPGGLYGQKRHPIHFLSGRTGIKTGEEYLHLVHQQDCVDAIVKIIEGDFFGNLFNLVSDLRILKKDYYTQMAAKLGLPAPHFESDAVNQLENPTKISNDKSKKMLSMLYRDPFLFT